MEKFEDMVVFARTLPGLRKRVDAELAASDELTYDRVLRLRRAPARPRLLPRRRRGLRRAQRELRPGDDEEEPRRACATACSSSTTRPSRGKRRVQAVVDPVVAEVVARPQAPPRRRRRAAGLQARPALGRPALGGHQRVPQGGDRQGRLGQGLPHVGARPCSRPSRWRSPRRPPATKTGRKRAITRAIKEVAHYLGNTPAVARASYIDPRVFDRYRDGEVDRPPARRRRGRAQRRRDGDPGPAREGRAEAARGLGGGFVGVEGLDGLVARRA